MKASIVACSIVVALSPLAESAVAAGATPVASAPSGAAAREGKWSELVPPDWNPRRQFVHVIVDRQSKGIRSMDVVRVSGRLQSSRLDTDLGSSGYEMRGAAVDRP